MIEKKINKKGFTLVELLAVIAILAILIILSLPSILELYNRSKVDAFVTQAKSIYKAAEQKYLSGTIKGSESVLVYDNEENPLNLTGGTVHYCIEMNPEGAITYFGIKDNQYTMIIESSSIAINDLRDVEKGVDIITKCETPKPDYGVIVPERCEGLYTPYGVIDKTNFVAGLGYTGSTYDAHSNGNCSVLRGIIAPISKMNMEYLNVINRTHFSVEGNDYIPVNDLSAGNKTYPLAINSRTNSFLNIELHGGNLTGSWSVSNFKLVFEDGYSNYVNNCIDDKYIEPLLFYGSNSHSSSYIFNLTGNNFLSTGNSGTGLFADVLLLIRIKDVPLSGVSLTSSKASSKTGIDGLIVRQYPEEFEISVTPLD